MDSPIAVDTSRETTRILIVEDVDFNQEILQSILTERGWRIIPATSGEAALEMLARDADFQIILMDIGLPGIDGVEAARRIKQNPKTRNIPIIALTAETVAEREHVLSAGLDGFVEKNFDPDQLIAEIERHLPHAAEQSAQQKAFSRPRPGSTDLDLDSLLAIFDSDLEIISRVVHAFFADAGKLMVRLSEAMTAGDRHEILVCCHGLKGSANILTAKFLAGAVEDLETCIRQDTQEAATALDNVQSAYDSLRETVKTRLGVTP